MDYIWLYIHTIILYIIKFGFGDGYGLEDPYNSYSKP